MLHISEITKRKNGRKRRREEGMKEETHGKE
jgi:hypothetical protein